MRGRLFPAAALALCAALVLSGCGKEDESRSIIMAAPPKNTEVPALEDAADSAAAPDPDVLDEPISLATATTALSGSYAGGENGCYTLATYSDGSADILYFDYAARTMTLLDKPEKPDEEFKGHLRAARGGMTPMLYEESLYLFRLGGTQELMDAHGDEGRAAIFRLDTESGALASTLLPAGWTFSLSSAILSDGESFYFLALDTDNTTVLAKIPIALDGECEELHRYEPGWEYSLEGFWEKGPVLIAAASLPPHSDPEFNVYWENREFKLLAQGMNTGFVEELKTWSQGTAASTQNDTFYYWSPEDTNLYALNTNTREETLVAEALAPDGYVQAQLMRTLLDGKLRVQFSTNRNIRSYSVDPATGEVAETPIDNLGDNVTVCAESSQGILVRNGEHWVAAAKVPDFVTGASPSPTNPNWVSMPTYALINAESYWAGSRSFTDIEDLVYD